MKNELLKSYTLRIESSVFDEPPELLFLKSGKKYHDDILKYRLKLPMSDEVGIRMREMTSQVSHFHQELYGLRVDVFLHNITYSRESEEPMMLEGSFVRLESQKRPRTDKHEVYFEIYFEQGKCHQELESKFFEYSSNLQKNE